MADLNSVIQTVQSAQQNKFDETMRFSNLNPRATSEIGTTIHTDANGRVKMTTTGESSLLQKIQVPGGFYRKCSSDLQDQILLEHYNRVRNDYKNEPEVLVRKIKKGNDTYARFVASDKYGIFDDVNVASAISKVDTFSKYDIKEFHQNDDFMVMRALSPEPLDVPGAKRPFFFGVQVTNSEVGRSSVKVKYFLWELVCTNGMGFNRGEFKACQIKHLGKRSEDQISIAVEKYIDGMDLFQDSAYNMLKGATALEAGVVLERIEKDHRVPKKIKTSLVEEYLPNYAPSLEEANGLDIISSYTEAIQQYSWETRLSYEDIAGELVTV